MPDPEAKARLLSVAEVAALLRVSRTTVTRLILEGHLPAHRVGRLYRVASAELEAFLRKGRT